MEPPMSISHWLITTKEKERKKREMKRPMHIKGNLSSEKWTMHVLQMKRSENMNTYYGDDDSDDNEKRQGYNS